MDPLLWVCIGLAVGVVSNLCNLKQFPGFFVSVALGIVGSLFGGWIYTSVFGISLLAHLIAVTFAVLLIVFVRMVYNCIVQNSPRS